MNINERVMLEKIVRLCSRLGKAESVFLTPNPIHYVPTFSLLDEIAKEFKISENTIGKWFNDEQGKITK